MPKKVLDVRTKKTAEDMPKRTREEDASTAPAPRPAPPMSAVAARRLRAQQAQAATATPEPAPAIPKPKKAKKQVTRSARQQLQDESAESKEKDDLRSQREAIERRIAQRATEIHEMSLGMRTTIVTEVGTEAEPDLSVVEPSPAKLDTATPERESALARMRREREERSRSAPADEDVDMASPAATDNEDDDMQLETTGSNTPTRTVEVSHFSPADDNCKTRKDGMRFNMHATETLVLVGIYKLKVKRGAVKVCGAVITQESELQIIYAPMSHALPVIEALPNQQLYEDAFDVKLSITNHHSGILKIGKLCPLFTTLWTSSSGEPTEFSFRPIFKSSANIPVLSVPEEWDSALVDLNPRPVPGAEPPRIVVVGAKGAGKSTFTRLLANTLLSSNNNTLAYLDVDPGQPEFSPPGTVSLHLLTAPVLSPTFAQNPSPLRAHHIGYTSPREDPAHYTACIIDLLTYHRAYHPEVPLLINTAGWTKGLGLELLQEICYNAQATHIVHLSPQRAQSSIIPDLAGQHTKTYELPSVAGAASRFSAADLRMLKTMSYFHRSGEDWDFSSPLTGFAPWVVPTTGPDAGVHAVSVLGEYIPTDLLPDALEATIVGVVVVSGEMAEPEEGTMPVLQWEMLPGPSECEFAGLAVVRKLDVEKGEVQLVTPMEGEEMERWDREGLRVCLVRGRLELAVWEMLCEGWKGEIPFVGEAGKGEGKGGGVWRVRRNVMRRGQVAR